jgi:hypothetical protein
MITPETRIADAQATLRANDRGGYTVPNPRIYPFQWNWDSAFVAMGFGTFDLPRAFDEIDLLLKGQWENGLVPHIVFHAPADNYFPGPAVWGTNQAVPSSGITQSPVLASAAKQLWDITKGQPEAEARLARIYPGLVRYHDWWRTTRDPLGTGLVTTLHPWETGGDNSPAWDLPLERVPSETITPVVRRDDKVVDPSMRPLAIDYQRYIHLVDTYREAGWDPARMLAAAPFRVADIGTNAILHRAELDLLALSHRFGTAAERARIVARIPAMGAAIARQWDPVDGHFYSRDLISDTPIKVATSAGFLPLWAGTASAAQVHEMEGTLRRWLGQVAYAVPSTNPSDPRYEPRRYWRGPIWSVVNWMIAEGFAGYGRDSIATRIRSDTRALVEKNGFWEYFDPRDGTGLGGPDFSWTAAIDLLLTP